MGKVVVTSDIHLGYANSDAVGYSSFLDSLSQRDDVDSFIILGDFVDMWRRDVSGLFLENHDILQKILSLQPKVKVYVVAGNHDYHLLQLKDHGYPFETLPNLVLDTGVPRYRFVHGWEFDSDQRPPIMELLCRNFSDYAGQVKSTLFSDLEDLRADLAADLDSLFHTHGGGKGLADHLMQPPEQRLQFTLSEVEGKAFASRQEGEILVFGHTHRPFVSADGNVVNTGSWVKDAPVHGTYIELDGAQARLFVFGGQEVTERTPVPNPRKNMVVG
ncbi:MAG: metallophosphoesterase [Thaumarchaeota archaeon]|nr:metallophosphoesterase [Nitrososphaerota archaeon]